MTLTLSLPPELEQYLIQEAQQQGLSVETYTLQLLQKSIFQFAQMGDYYTLSLGKLKPGKYTWIASTTYHGKNYTKKGMFFVENKPIETFDIVSRFVPPINKLNPSEANFCAIANPIPREAPVITATGLFMFQN
jgi:hypothetical protein